MLLIRCIMALLLSLLSLSLSLVVVLCSLLSLSLLLLLLLLLLYRGAVRAPPQARRPEEVRGQEEPAEEPHGHGPPEPRHPEEEGAAQGEPPEGLRGGQARGHQEDRAREGLQGA